MHPCPTCGSGNIHRSRAKTRWEGWRQTVTGQRLYRCRKCNWRGWGADRGSSRASDGAVAPEPPNLGTLGLARPDRGNDLDLDALDAVVFPTDERT
jgi:predicted RNA-binding Zn-ribbon protein involved in translation (DUF1610 family)